MPAALPIHRTPFESSNKPFKSSDGSPSRIVKVRQIPFDIELKPLGVANQMVPSGLSAIEVTVLEARPSAVVWVLKRPSLNSLTPAFRVAAHTAPSVPTCTA